MVTELDEIVEIIELDEEETIDILTNGNHLFWANDILTHNSGVDEIEFDHSHISGGLSKIQTADNVFAIYTSRAMRERGRYQLQLMKTRNSSGVGQKIDLDFNVDSLRITSVDGESNESNGNIQRVTSSIIDSIKRKTAIIPESENTETKKINAEVSSSKIRNLLNSMENMND